MLREQLDLRASVAEYLSRKFVLSLLVALIVILAAVIIGAWVGTHVSESEAQDYLNILNEQAEEATWGTILLNNLGLSLLTLIPFLGVALILYIMFNTGFFLGAVAVAILPGNPLTRLILVLFVTFLVPGFIVAFFEFGAYVLLLGEVFCVTYLALTRSGAKQRLREHFWKTLLIYTILLVIGAIVESALMTVQF